MNIGVFASGAGSNAEAIIRHFNREGSRHKVTLVVTNRASAGVIARAKALGVDCEVVTTAAMADRDRTAPLLEAHGVGFVALAGYLALIPEWMLDDFEGRIVNIHPSLLPRHGGKGMYGHHVHEAVVASGDSVTGITIHHVDKHYDNGAKIFTAEVAVGPGDTTADVERRVRELELRHYPEVIESLVSGMEEQG